jgi:hypothetical protein
MFHSLQPVVIVGSHHKTGTYLTQKIFARICSVMKWCCVFHVTKDSLVAVRHTLMTEPGKLCLSKLFLVPYESFSAFTWPHSVGINEI